MLNLDKTKIILFKYCADVKNCKNFRGFGFIYLNLDKTKKFVFKYYVDVENCERFRDFEYI